MPEALPCLPEFHLPVHRHSPIFVRAGAEPDSSALLNRVSKVTALLELWAVAVGHRVPEGQTPFADDTPVRLLVPGTGKQAIPRILVIHGSSARHSGQEAVLASLGEGEMTR